MTFIMLVFTFITLLTSAGSSVGNLYITTEEFSWILSNENQSISVNGSVPGGVYTDLMNGGVLENGDFYYRYNDIEYRWVSYENWSYTTFFHLPEDIMNYEGIVLEFEGIDTRAQIYLNDQLVDENYNMFARKIVDIKDHIQTTDTVKLEVALRSPVKYAEEVYDDYYENFGYEVLPECVDDAFRGECHANTIRKMQASFGGDWGPAFPSLGIWKPLRIIGFSQLRMTNLYFESRPISSLPSDYGASWAVYFKIFFDLASPTGDPFEAAFKVTLDGEEYWHLITAIDPSQFEGGTGFVEDNFIVPEDTVYTWWPNGFGTQYLYNFSAIFEPLLVEDVTPSTLTVRVGFRQIEVDQSFVNESLPTLGRYFRVKVNNVFLFLKGSNWIPAHVLPEQVTPEYTQRLLQGARESNQNCLRVWGGGIYESDLFYQLADEMGILIWQDMMFACSMYPGNEEFLEITRQEVTTQVKRLQYHPSLMLYATNNENEAALKDNWYGTDPNYDKYKDDYVKLYVKTVAEAILEVDSSRYIAISSPSDGIKTVEQGYIAENPSDPLYGDNHFYDYESNGWDYRTYPRPRMVTEFGFQSYPSYFTLAPVFNRSDIEIDSEMMEHRQHHPNGLDEMDRQLKMHFNYNASQTSFINYLYLLQVNQAMSLKTEAEFYRRIRDTMFPDGGGLTKGILYWQLNDIWQGASWSSIEYGGRWKMAHYYIKNVFNGLTLIPWIEDGKLRVMIVSDFAYKHDSDLTLSIYFYKFSSNEYVRTFSYYVRDTLEPQSTSLEVELDLSYDFNLTKQCAVDSNEVDPLNNCIAIVNLYDSFKYKRAPSNFVLFGEPKDIILKEVNIKIIDYYQYQSEITIVLYATKLALFVFLETPYDGFFSDNGFILPMRTSTAITFYGSEAGPPLEEFFQTLTITHLSNYPEDRDGISVDDGKLVGLIVGIVVLIVVIIVLIIVGIVLLVVTIRKMIIGTLIVYSKSQAI